MKNIKLCGLITILSILFTVGLSGNAFAVPALQLYVEGASYDPVTETWVTSHQDNFNLQVIGANQNIYDVSLAIAVSSGENGTVTINGTTIGPFENGTPVTGDGSLLPYHGVYPTDYDTYFVGNFTPQYTVYDMTPGETGSALGEIKTYAVSISDFSWVHFDAYDHVVQNEKHIKYVKAPFSHDADWTPEPASFTLLGLGLLGLLARFKTTNTVGNKIRKRRR